MNSVVSVKNKTSRAHPPKPENGAAQEIYYPVSEKKIMGETDYHFQQIQLLFQLLQSFFESREDIYVSSDIMFYYEEGNPRRRFAPDVMVCFGLENKKRRSYKLWEEKIVPSVIIEIASNETWEKDVTTKRRLYEQLGVKEFYVFDAEYNYLPQPLMVYHLEFGELVRQAITNRRIFSPALELELVDTGENLRLFDVGANELLPTASELKAELDKLKQKQK